MSDKVKFKAASYLTYSYSGNPEKPIHVQVDTSLRLLEGAKDKTYFLPNKHPTMLGNKASLDCFTKGIICLVRYMEDQQKGLGKEMLSSILGELSTSLSEMGTITTRVSSEAEEDNSNKQDSKK